MKTLSKLCEYLAFGVQDGKNKADSNDPIHRLLSKQMVWRWTRDSSWWTRPSGGPDPSLDVPGGLQYHVNNELTCGVHSEVSELTMCVRVSGGVWSGPFILGHCCYLDTCMYSYYIHTHTPIQSLTHILVYTNKFYIHSSLVQVDILEHVGIDTKIQS